MFSVIVAQIDSFNTGIYCHLFYSEYQVNEMAFNYSIRKNGSISAIDLIGELKVSDLSDYSHIFEDMISEDSNRIIINMQHLSYIDSTAIGLIVNFKREVDKHEGLILVCCVPQDIMKVFDITGISRFITIYKTEAEAVEAAEKFTEAE